MRLNINNESTYNYADIHIARNFFSIGIIFFVQIYKIKEEMFLVWKVSFEISTGVYATALPKVVDF